MKARVLLWLSVGFLVGVSGAPIQADEQPAAPSPLEGLQEQDLEEPSGPADPFAYLRSFLEWLTKHTEAPPRTRRDTALFDIWNAALRPRAARMAARIERLLKREHWLPETGTPERVKPSYWSRFIREVAALMTELNGAWNQYQRARIRIKRGIPPDRLRPPGSYYGYALPAAVWRRGLLARGRLIHRRLGTAGGVVVGGGVKVGGVHIGGKVHIGPHLSPLVLHSYWNLMRRYRAGWTWRLHHCYECERRRLEAQRQKLEEYIAERQRIFDTTRDTLEQQILSLRLLIAAMQAQEEHYLAEDLAQLGDSEEVLAANERTLVALADQRIRAEQYPGDSSAAYGQLLRGWTRIYNLALARIKKARGG